MAAKTKTAKISVSVSEETCTAATKKSLSHREIMAHDDSLPRPHHGPAPISDVLRLLKRAYPDAHCALLHEGPFQLLCATILSAQCTDERVNKVTPALFARFPDARAMARAPLAEVEELVKSTNFFLNKARALVECAGALVERHGGKVPQDLEALTALRGVGRKTANVVLGNSFDVPSMVVDTHVGRLSRRLGLTKKTDPVDVEQGLMKTVPREDWTMFAHLLIFHGRNRCMARNPDCEHCELKAICPRKGVGR